MNPYAIKAGFDIGSQLLNFLGGTPDPYKKLRREARSQLGKDVINVDRATQTKVRNQLPLIKATERAAMRGGANFGEGTSLALDKISPAINRSSDELNVKNDVLKSQRDSGIRRFLAGIPQPSQPNPMNLLGGFIGTAGNAIVGDMTDKRSQAIREREAAIRGTDLAPQSVQGDLPGSDYMRYDNPAQTGRGVGYSDVDLSPQPFTDYVPQEKNPLAEFEAKERLKWQIAKEMGGDNATPSGYKVPKVTDKQPKHYLPDVVKFIEGEQKKYDSQFNDYLKENKMTDLYNDQNEYMGDRPTTVEDFISAGNPRFNPYQKYSKLLGKTINDDLGGDASDSVYNEAASMTGVTPVHPMLKPLNQNNADPSAPLTQQEIERMFYLIMKGMKL